MSLPHRGSWIKRRNARLDPACMKDPALPVLRALTSNQLEKVA
jgi:hypothetical protein